MGDHLPGSGHFFFIAPCFDVIKGSEKKIKYHHGSGDGKYRGNQLGSSLSQRGNIAKAEYIANGDGRLGKDGSR